MTLAVPAALATAIAVQASGAVPAQAAGTAVQAQLSAHKVAYGRDVVLKGTAPSSDAGQALALQYAPASSSSWQTVATTTVPASGSFTLSAPLRNSGLVRVVPAPRGTPTSTGRTPALAQSNAATAVATSAQRVTVAAALQVQKHKFAELGGHTIAVHGKLMPGTAGRHVLLQERSGGHWTAVAHTRTGSHGSFALHYATGSLGVRQLRVRFAGDNANGRANAAAGQLTVYREAVASWYNDGGLGACSGHAYYGVANKTLPCGTKVNFRLGNRSVTATVDDRGPFVAGREWDLNQNTAAALGFQGVETVWSSQ
jgi:hypothetical protein